MGAYPTQYEFDVEIHELDMNPLKVLNRGVRAVDVRVRVGGRPLQPSTRRICC